ncbi:hypothetical protein J4714_14205 [Staphylococcus epidermidis]|nr:hypothetical protein [Staphylococcus epidermidis]
MKTSQAAIHALSRQVVGYLPRHREKRLRALPTGSLALTPHPVELGSALTHPHIITDYSESQLELITGARLVCKSAGRADRSSSVCAA